MARDRLNELKWHPGRSPEGVVIEYVHRGAPGDRRRVGYEDIIALERSFILISTGRGEARIPYHRITKISQGARVLWSRKP